MSLLNTVDPEGLLEFSVVYTDRSVNHMSALFQETMRYLHSELNEVYQADTTILVPGSGTYGMEAVARQFANNKKCLVIRNGWFSFRWSQILDTANLTNETIVLKAQPSDDSDTPIYSPVDIDRVVSCILTEKPEIVFAPHVETAAGLMLPESYIKAVANAAHKVGALFVLDCIASGTVWLDMKILGIDVLISAPQKGWSSSPCCGIVMLGERAIKVMENTTSNSFAIDLKKWYDIMQTYVNGAHAYHATMPTDGIVAFSNTVKEAKKTGYDKLKEAQFELEAGVQAVLDKHGYKRIAAKGFRAPGVIVSYTKDSDIHNGKKLVKQGLQIAAGVPLQCDEPAGFQTFRIGLFGFDKLHDVKRTIKHLEDALAQL